MKFIYIKWFDSCYDRGSLQKKDIKDTVVLENIGFLIKETKESFCMALEYCEEWDNYRYIISIPKVNIIKKKIRNIN